MKNNDLDPDMIAALESWMFTAIHERRGPGHMRDGQFEGYSFADFINVLNDIAPDAIARMLQAGAAAYLRPEG